MTNKDSSSTNGDSFCLQISTNSSLSCESDISSFSFDKEVDTYTNRVDADELPAFEIRLLSPFGRSPSPIDSDMEFFSSPNKSCITPTRNSASSAPSNKKPHGNYKDNEEFVLLNDINAQISPPSDSDSSITPSICDSPLGGGGNLETIFEGVFLNTPPKQRLQRKNNSSSGSKQRASLLERIAINRLNFVAAADKENVEMMDSGSGITTTKTKNTPDDG